MPCRVTRLQVPIETRIALLEDSYRAEKDCFRFALGFVCFFAPISIAIGAALVWDALRGWENPSWAIFIMFALLAMFGIPFIFMTGVAWFSAEVIRDYKRRLKVLRDQVSDQ